MAFQWQDNLHSTTFTPRDYQVELLAAACEQNLVICLGHNSSKEFIALKLILEHSNELRRLENRKRTLFITRDSHGGDSAFNLLFHLTDLSVINLNSTTKAKIDFEKCFDKYQVIILSTELCIDALICSYLDLKMINMIVIEDCHKNSAADELQQLFEFMKDCKHTPKILGLAGAIHNAACSTNQLDFQLQRLEKAIHCRAETASDIVTVLRYCTKPSEFILECPTNDPCELTEFLRDLVETRKRFLDDHRFDMSEIYSDEFDEEVKAIPDPKKEPIDFFEQFLDVLDEFGPWCADRAALLLIMQIEKAKIKTPYERHYLLLCLVSTTLIQIRAHCDHIFGQIEADKERINRYSSPKVRRILDVLRQFKPENDAQSTPAKKQLSEYAEKRQAEINSLDFGKVTNSIETTVKNIENEQPQNEQIVDGLKAMISNETCKESTNLKIVRKSEHKSPQKFTSRTKGRKMPRIPRSHHSHHSNDPDALCGLIFCESKFIAKVLFSLFHEVSRNDQDLEFLTVQYTVDRIADPITESRQAESEHRRQEEVLKRFRMHTCNLLIGTSVLEEGIELPKCNLVVRWDPPKTYRSYVQCKGRARAHNACHIIMVAPVNRRDAINKTANENLTSKSHRFVCDHDEHFESAENENVRIDDVDEDASKLMERQTEQMIERLSQYMHIERLLMTNCSNREPSIQELIEADRFSSCIRPYQPLVDAPFVNLTNSILLVNKYCAKLPSDTFTKLTPLWRCAKTVRNSRDFYQYTVRLPINSPVKQDIIGLPMPSRILARRMTALIACKVLHQSGELDDSLQPIGKEGFRASEPDWENFDLDKEDEEIVNDNSDPRPGTTRRRQYYYKRVASAFSSCRPIVQESAYLYFIKMELVCPIPEEQNTRGRKIYPPEDALQGFGILTRKRIPKLSAFSIFTRSGEVQVSLELAADNVILDERQLSHVNTFLKYTFSNVLRLQKYLMLYDPEATENSFFVVPTQKSGETNVVDWKFLDVIANNCDKMPTPIPGDIRKEQPFDAEIFKDAVVMPWYRNQDQPQYFYVAEICYHLSPESSFPGDNYATFREYYFRKYNISIQNHNQPLLDVDHTSARLNFLTPRYVNRKGVALPTSSEETKRAKRENLEQKQILVPELCTIHPFPASLWRAAVCLPCILYRFNALLLADEIRNEVARDIALGTKNIQECDEFQWPVLDFGWSLADVLKKAKDSVKEATPEKKEIEAKEENGEQEEKEMKNEEKSKKVNEITENGTHSVNGEIDESENELKTANDLLSEVDKKLKSDNNFIEIGTWSNDMAENLRSDSDLDDEEWDGILPPNVNLCSSDNTNVRYGSPTSWEIPQEKRVIHNYYPDSDASYQSDDDFDYESDDDDDEAGLKIEFKSDNVAEAIETEEDIQKRQRQIEIINDINANEKSYQSTKNIGIGYDFPINRFDLNEVKSFKKYEDEYLRAIEAFRDEIKCNGILIRSSESFRIPKKREKNAQNGQNADFIKLKELFSFLSEDVIKAFIEKKKINDNFQLSLDDVYELNRVYFIGKTNEIYTIEGNGSIFDRFNDNDCLSCDKKTGEWTLRLEFNEFFKDRTLKREKITDATEICVAVPIDESIFSFDRQPDLTDHPGPSPSMILQALTMSNANDGINLERLETIGDSFLKYAITTYLYCTYENVHEGKLSHLRSRQVSNLNLYRLGRRKLLGENMIATKFEPHDNWLPPCYYVPKDLEKALIEAKIPACYWDIAQIPNVKEMNVDEICRALKEIAFGGSEMEDDEYGDSEEELDGSAIDGVQMNGDGIDDMTNGLENEEKHDEAEIEQEIEAQNDELGMKCKENEVEENERDNTDDSKAHGDDFPCFIPYNLVTQHSIPDKSIADCVEALIGAYLIDCGPRGALLFMAWLGIRVLPCREVKLESNEVKRITGSTRPYQRDGESFQTSYGYWAAPKSPLLHYAPDPYATLEMLLDGYAVFEAHLGYHFNDRSYLLQSMTHASYSPNRLTDCYQRLEFLGDAVLDYLITRHLYEDPRQHSPGALTDLRSALVNNTIFASLAVRHGFHKYFRHLSPGLNDVVDRFVRIQHENGHSISEEFYLISEDECDEAEDVEVPKALGDIFESVAGAIFLDSNMSLDTVWKVYSNMMRPEIEQFSNSVPKSPIRELLELEPETAKFGKPEKLADGRRVRVTVDVFGKGTFRGIGRNYRIAKCTAAKCALRQLKKHGLINRKH